MPITRKNVAQITYTDILELVLNRTREDAFVEFKEVLFHRGLPPKERDEQKDDFAQDVVALANAQGGHIIIGIKDHDHCASELKPMDNDQATRIADTARDTVIQRVKPNVHMEVGPLATDKTGSQWVVVAFVPESSNKPHMWAFGDKMHFVIRDNDRKRRMEYDEIKEMFLKGPREQWVARILSELQSLRSVVEALSGMIEK
jgi:predicted HTH transcriptional regulator